jgi:trk system potassium uptake protein TrkA
LRKLKLPSGIIIGAVAHGDAIVIPGGDTVIQAHDRVIVFTLPEVVTQAEKWFSE